MNPDHNARCHPQYLSERAYRKFSKPGAFDRLRIHTDELQEVISKMLPGSLSHAIVSVPSYIHPKSHASL